MRRALVALVVLLLPGCLQADAPPPAAREGAPGTEAPFLGVRALVDADETLWEPMLGVTPEGVLFSGSFARGGPGGWARGAVYRSTDGGLTWEDLGDPAGPTGASDPHLAVDGDGAVWFSTLWLGCVSVAVSRDLGASWSRHPAACAGAVGDRQHLVPTRGGHAILDWQQFPTKRHVASVTDDHGRTWRPGGLVEPGVHTPYVTGEVSGWGGSAFWSPATGLALVTFAWFERVGGPADLSPAWRWGPAFSATADGGASWTLHRLPSRGAFGGGLGAVVGAADDAGGLYLAWTEPAEDEGEGEWRVMMAASHGDPRVWGEPVRVDEPGRGAGGKVMPALVGGARGEVAVAWLEEGPDGAWRVRVAWSRDARSPEGATFGRATVDGAPAKAGRVCMDGLSCEGDRELGDYFGMARLPDGRLGLLWTSTEEAPGVATLAYGATARPVLSPRP